MKCIEKEIAGNENDFLKVTYLKLKGSNYEIGKKLAEIAKIRHNVAKVPWTDPVKVTNQIKFMKKNYPIHYERMKGAASFYGMDLDKNSDIDFSGLYYYMGVPGCTAVYYPPHSNTNNAGILSRNFDFTTGTVMGSTPDINNKAVISRPYIIETYPDKGYNSLYLCSFDLLGGVIDGINSKGLTVAILADDETPCTYPPESILGSGVGIHELLIMRMVLDTCADVNEAKELLLSMKQFYFFAPLHYIIGDRLGNSFVYEHSYTLNKEYIINGENKPQIVTNFLLHRYPDTNKLPDNDELGGRMYKRYRVVDEALKTKNQKLTIDDIKDVNSRVFWDVGSRIKHEAVPRTLWHSIYNTKEMSLSVSFYLHDEITDGKKQIIRSPYINFKLDK